MLMITDADHMLAAELGLFLVREHETDEDRADAAHPSASRSPETWLARSVVTKKRLGRLRFTAVDCLYVTKYTVHDIHGIEETVAEALRWITPIVRHARTGTYEGTEIIVRPFGALLERPRALTECGAKSTGADFNPIAVKSALINGQAHEMCPACRKKLEGCGAVDLSHLSEKRGSSSPRQRDYIRRLLDEGARNGRPYLVEARTIDQMSNRSASAMINQLKALKERSWKGDL